MIFMLKAQLKNILKFFGFELRKIHPEGNKTNIFARRANMYEVLEHICNLGLKPQTIIDVGVANGTFELYENFPDAFHLLVEPLVEYEAALQDICIKYKAEYVISAATNHSGTITINIHPDQVGSSILKETEGVHADGIPRQVATVTLDELCEKRNLLPPYAIKIDVQGAELIVLDGAKNLLRDTEVIILEVSLFKFHIDAPEFYDVVSYMKDRRFVVYDIFGGHNRPIDGALAQVDMVFVKEDGLFRKTHNWANPEQRQMWSMKNS